MKNLVSIMLLATSAIAFGQVKWLTLDQALAMQKTSPKKIIINFYSSQSSQCDKMEKDTYGNPVISEIINNKFYPVRFNINSDEEVFFKGKSYKKYSSKEKNNPNTHSFAKFMNISTVPTVVFLDENIEPITNLMGPLTAKDVEPYFNMISTNAYKNIKTREQWDNYQKKFKSKIK